MADDQEKYTRIKNAIDKAYVDTEDTRERSSDDLMFARFNQWDEALDEYSDNEYRGQFDIITRQLRQVAGEMMANPISVSYRPTDDDNSSKEGAKILNGMYRASMRSNSSKEAIDIAIDSQITAGMGAWRLRTRYVDENENDNDMQMIEREPIHEAHNVVYFDSMSKRKDKSDAKWACILSWYTDEGYADLIEEYGYDRDERTGTSVKSPSESGVYPWNHGERNYVGEYYEKTNKKRRIVILENPMTGERLTVERKEREEIDLALENGFIEVARKTVKSTRVEKYIVDGQGIIDGPTIIAGKHIPVIPLFGEWRFIEGQEWWEGMVRRAKDPQRLHNMGMSFIADQVGRTPRRKPIFNPEQIQGYEGMYAQGSDYAYYLLNSKDADGNPLPQQPVGYMEGPTINAAETAFLELTQKAVQDVTITPAVGANAVSDGVTEGQLRLANQTNMMQTFIYQDSLATAMRRDGEIFASMAAEIYQEEIDVTVADEDDSIRTETINEQGFDRETGLPTIERRIADVDFEVYTDIGPRYKDQKDQAMQSMRELMGDLGPQNPLFQVLALEYISYMDIPGSDGLKELIDKQRLVQGLKKPETREDMLVLQQAQQAQQPDANMVLAMAEQQKAQADLITAQTKQQAAQYDAVSSVADAELTRAKTAETLNKLQPDQIEQLNRLLEVMKKGQEIDNMQLKANSEQLDNASKLAGMMGIQ